MAKKKTKKKVNLILLKHQGADKIHWISTLEEFPVDELVLWHKEGGFIFMDYVDSKWSAKKTEAFFLPDPIDPDDTVVTHWARVKLPDTENWGEDT